MDATGASSQARRPDPAGGPECVKLSEGISYKSSDLFVLKQASEIAGQKQPVELHHPAPENAHTHLNYMHVLRHVTALQSAGISAALIQEI